MEEVMKMLKDIQMELNEQKVTIVQSAEKVTEQVTQNINCTLEEKFNTIDQKYENIKEKLEIQEKRLYVLEKQSRQRNIVIFGLPEAEKSYAELEKNILCFLNQYFSVGLELGDIQETRRIGKKGEKTRPITVTFCTLGTKIQIFKQRRLLKDTNYYIKEDFPQQVLEKRRELQEQVITEREKGNFATIKYDKLIIHNKNADSSNNKKRTLPISPISPNCNDLTQADPKTQAHKKNKIKTRIQRSSSVSDGVIKPGILGFLTTKTQTINNQNNQTNDLTNKNNKQ